MMQKNSSRKQHALENIKKVFPIVEVHKLLRERTRFPEENQRDHQKEAFSIEKEPLSLWKKIALTELEAANEAKRIAPEKQLMTNQEVFPIEREPFFLWKGISLIELAVEACTLYYYIEDAIDNRGRLKERYQDKINDLHARLLPKISIDDCNIIIDSTCRKGIQETPELLLELGLCCWLLYRFIILNTFTKKDDIACFIMCDFIVSKTTNKVIGYWTAKMEKRVKNPGAAAMKEKGQKNAQAVRDIIEQLNITSTGAFKKEKELRKAFFREAKKNDRLYF